MINLYNKTCYECAKLITKRYSTSFSMGIMLFDKEFREPIYNIYAFVRFADEIVDTFYENNQRALLEEFRTNTFNAINNRISLNPVLHAFQVVVNEYNIDHHLIEAFLESMEMDLDKQLYDKQSYKEYIYGSAEVVGLMCLKVFLKNEPDKYNDLVPSACALGSAFQKVNFLRDIKSDYQDRGRIYFPGVDFNNFGEEEKQKIEDDIQSEFDFALKGIEQLPRGVRLGVFTAYKYYLNLFKKIKNSPKNTILENRVRIPNSSKILIMGKAAIRDRLNFL